MTAQTDTQRISDAWRTTRGSNEKGQIASLQRPKDWVEKKSYPSGFPYSWGWLTFLFRKNLGQSYFNSVARGRATLPWPKRHRCMSSPWDLDKGYAPALDWLLCHTLQIPRLCAQGGHNPSCSLLYYTRPARDWGTHFRSHSWDVTSGLQTWVIFSLHYTDLPLQKVRDICPKEPVLLAAGNERGKSPFYNSVSWSCVTWRWKNKNTVTVLQLWTWSLRKALLSIKWPITTERLVHASPSAGVMRGVQRWERGCPCLLGHPDSRRR